MAASKSNMREVDILLEEPSLKSTMISALTWQPKMPKHIRESEGGGDYRLELVNWYTPDWIAS